jgi:predicted TPR repeat methyltransferase
MKDFTTIDQDLLARRLEAVFSLHQAGELTQAELLYRELINNYPDIWQLFFNCGLLLFELGRFEEALECNLRGLAINPASDDLLYNCALCQKKLGRYRAAIESYLKALDINPDDIDSLYNLAGCFRSIDDEHRAEQIYRDVIERAPDHLPSLNNLAYLTHKRGEIEGALQLYENILKIDPGHESADFMRAALSGETRTHSPESYVQEVFDEFAEHYEQSLTVKLGYDLPSSLYDFYGQQVPDHKPKHALDLGCGTGLVGQKFSPLCRSMTGVDISAKMLEAARHKDLYDSLHNAEIIDYLINCPGASYDLAVSADVLPYLGSLEELLRRLLPVLVAGGHFLFSVEDYPEEVLHPVLRHSGRFAHSSAYIQTVAGQTGWHIIAMTKLDLRKERGEWIQGSVYLISPHRIS